MKKILLVCVFMAISGVAYSYDKVLHDNPGFFKSPGFIGIGGTTVYAGKNTDRDKEIRPFFIAMLNLVQSEYGNIGLSYGFIPIMPDKRYRDFNGMNFQISSQQYSNEIGLNYVTGSTWINFFLGAGYNANYVISKLRNVSNAETGAESSFNKSYTQWTYGWQYYIGIEYVLTKDGRWGLFFLFRGSEPERSKYKLDTDVDFRDGSSKPFVAELDKSLRNVTYTLGLIYHF